jgi:hypothetical protein
MKPFKYPNCILIGMYRRAFSLPPLIYIPPPSTCSLQGWFTSSRCKWDACKSLRKTPRLKDIYPELSEFFYTTLRLQDAGLQTIIDEVLCINPCDGLKYVSRLFSSLSLHLSMNPSFLSSRTELRRRIRRSSIFPVTLDKCYRHSHIRALQQPTRQMFGSSLTVTI